MIEDLLQYPRNALKRAIASVMGLHGWALLQAAALVAGAAFAYKGAQILNEDRQAVLRNFDEGVPWLGLALLATLVAAWVPALPKVSARSWPAALAEFWRAHWVEILLFALILGFGVFMRLYRFGGTLPPSDGLCCEEHINGGVAFRALEGDRPLSFPLVRWGSAAGFLLFGENTLGLRFVFVLMGIATLALFYLLLRQLASWPAALFGFALFAAAWWPALRSRSPSDVTFYSVLFALFLVRGLKTKSPMMFLGAGVIAGLMSYEYEAFKQVPMIAAGFVGAAALREVLLRRPLRLEAARERALALFKVAWRPALIFLMAAGIVLAPLIIGTRNGHDLYLTSVHRNEADRGGDLFVDDWQQRVQWATQIFLPFGPRDYVTSPPLDVRGTPLVDPLAASLAVVGLAAGAIFFFRGFRLFFVSWFVLTLAAGALLIQNFGAWKFLGLVPVALVLATLFVDDIRSLMVRAFGATGRWAVAGLLVLGAAFSFWWNANALYNDVAPALAARSVYSGKDGQFYTYCDYLRERGTDDHAFAFSSINPVLGFAWPRDTLEQQMKAWGDFIWVCHDLDGTALPAAEEAWPLRDLPSGPTTLVFSTRRGPMTQLIEELNRAYPGLGQPDRRITGPNDNYNIISYEFDSGQELARYGLWADYTPSGAGTPTISRVDPAYSLSWEQEGLPLSLPFTVRWRGIVYVDEEETLSLQAVSDDPVEVRLDGQVIYTTRSGQPEAAFVDLLSGWHPVEITLDKQQEGGEFRLSWVQPGGGRQALQPQDLFALAELRGWLHQQTLAVPEGGEQWTTQRFDFAPHYSSGAVVKLTAQRDGPLPLVASERWQGVWEVDQPGSYLLKVEFSAGVVVLLLDGEPVPSGATAAQAPAQFEAEVTVPAGRHTLELVQELESDAVWSGGTLSVWRLVPSPTEDAPPERVEFPFRVMPY